MLQMDTTTNNQSKPETIYLKNMVIVFGIFLSLLAFTSFTNWSNSIDTIDNENSEELMINVNSVQSEVLETVSIVNESKLKTHHNFIASYLLQESNFSRKVERNKDENNFFTNLKQLHKIIISQALSGM